MSPYSWREPSPPAYAEPGSGTVNHWFVGGYQLARDWASDEENRRYHHLDLADIADEVPLVVELAHVESALGVIDPRREPDVRWLRVRRQRLLDAIHEVRRRSA